jgi:hypothetical protein
MKKIVLSLALSMTALTADAATIVLQSGTPAQEFRVQTSPTTTAPLSLASGGIVIGFFRNYTAAMNPMLADPNRSVLDFVAQNFIPIGTLNSDADYGTNSVANPVSLRPIVGPPPGTTAAGTIENSTWLTAGGANTVQDGGLVRGTRIFVLAYDGLSLSTATDLGIYSASTWTLPTSTILNTLSMSLPQTDVLAEVYRGSIGSLILAPVVPEPSTSLMALLAGLGMIARRRR